MEKLKILGEAAKYDVSCASSGVNRAGSGRAGTIGNSVAWGICHTFTGDGRCVSLLKVLQTNDCVYDCKYCINRRSAPIERASFSPREVAELTMNFYKRNYIEGLFLSSAVKRSPDDTMAVMCETIRLLRQEYGFFGYIHCKSIPGADPLLIEQAGRLADRMSVNVELPSEDSLSLLAPQKKKTAIFQSMRYIQGRMEEDRGGIKRLDGAAPMFLGSAASGQVPSVRSAGTALSISGAAGNLGKMQYMPESFGKRDKHARHFVPGGQSTQMIIGATSDTDRTIVNLAEAFYKKMRMKRVYYSAYIPIYEDSALPPLLTKPPLLREHRLYQADWLLRFYGYEAKELLDDSHPNLDLEYDPKCDWALRHLEMFPVEINRADRDTLLRVPGIGVISANRILEARRLAYLDFDQLKKIGVVLKRARFFITCKGKTMGPLDMEPGFIKANLSVDARSAPMVSHYQQTSLFDQEERTLFWEKELPLRNTNDLAVSIEG